MGQSLANVADRICSWPENGTLPSEGLSPLGREQVVKSATAFIETLTLEKRSVIKLVSSDFTRAKETALIILDELKSHGYSDSSLIYDIRLRERHFGEFEGRSGSEGYPKVWEYDAARKLYPGVESPESVAYRSLEAVSEVLMNPTITLPCSLHMEIPCRFYKLKVMNGRIR
ncbi:phosphoglycerate mutase-like protein [Rhizoclosmatium globosum]|uniref:Phosphoglycerate mutase-like protein n=1 Tax=Rhizoclosmatium globosum TaxID=329046 RepID=A0A1Y2C2T0_9FUNG|nr:phosphoglycerate mutase-like protein [Rhizoclosmatium globosum]|eukprot:ORY41352.1 phosphoglycerate mutase-like protein [Rhizoclosmatium globosum]